MPIKTYIRSPNDDYAPGNNIQLGHVWRNPRDPGSFVGTPIAIPGDIEINHTQKGSWTIDLGCDSNAQIGFWAKIAQLPIISSISGQWGKTQDGAYKIPTMDTYSIEPTPAYVKASVESVAMDILKAGYNLYMITGVKVARGGEGSNKESMNSGAGLKAGMDTWVPLEGSEQISYSKGKYNNSGFGSTGDFVFAYRMRELYYRKGVVDHREYNKGAALGENMIPIDNSDEEEMFVIKDAKIDDDDVEIDGDRYSIAGGDDEEGYNIIVLP
ncbi:hypothetical protein FQN49_007810 [Arthroderma sp. PD_2]|nr:hypothetical protein FQN49_007810 [Arthroderma sp. PD_2]